MPREPHQPTEFFGHLPGRGNQRNFLYGHHNSTATVGIPAELIELLGITIARNIARRELRFSVRPIQKLLQRAKVVD
jgi:hypothetical protein